MTESQVSRRQVVCGLAMLGATGAVAACARSATPATAPSPSGLATSPSPVEAPSASGGGAPSPTAAPSPEQTAPGALARVSAIPVGGGVIVNDPSGAPILLTQPKAGVVVGFDPTCTHQGTQVNPPVNNVIECPNHHSRFKATDGSVINGPAAAPLNEIAVRVVGGAVVLA